MPVIAPANLARLRTTRHATRLALAVYQPATIWSARVDGAQTQGDTTITVKNIVQVRAPARHFVVRFGSAAGLDDYGQARWRSYSAPTLTVAAHNAQLPNDAYITVLEWIEPTAIHAAIDEITDVVSEDGDVAYTDENTNYPPLARMGAPACAYLDSATGKATINFYGRGAAIAPGATLTAHAWAFGAGAVPATAAIEGTSGAPIAVEYTGAGARYVAYTVTDSNGKTHTRYTPVFLFDRFSGALPHTNLEVSGIECDASNGLWRATLKVFTSAPIVQFPNRALVVLFSEDFFDAEKISIGNETHRENIKLVGYIREGSQSQNWAGGYVEFQVDSMPLDGMWQPAHYLETAGAPAGWHQLSGMTYALAAHHIVTRHTTLSQIADVYLHNLPNYPVEFVDLPDTSLADVLRQVISPIRSRLGFSAPGSFYLEANPQLTPFATRSTAYQIATTDADLIGDVAMSAERQDKEISQIDFCGEDAIGDPFFSLAPGTPHPSGRIERVENIRVADQAEANLLAGLFEAHGNNSFTNVILQWRGNYPFDCFPSEPIAVSIAANQNARGIVWTNQRCWITRVSCEYRDTSWIVTTTVEKDTHGIAGTGVAPDDGAIGVYPPTLPAFPGVYPPIPIMPPIAPPPSAVQNAAYDIADGMALNTPANATRKLLYTIMPRRFTITSISLVSPADGVILTININGVDRIVAEYVAGAEWQIKIYSASAVLVETWTAATTSGTVAYKPLTGSSVITVLQGYVLRATLAVGANAVATFGYGLGGRTY